MIQTYYYAIGSVVKELDAEGYVIESYVYLDKRGIYSADGIDTAVVHTSEFDALKLAQSVQGRVVRVHRDYVEKFSIEVEA